MTAAAAPSTMAARSKNCKRMAPARAAKRERRRQDRPSQQSKSRWQDGRANRSRSRRGSQQLRAADKVMTLKPAAMGQDAVTNSNGQESRAAALVS